MLTRRILAVVTVGLCLSLALAQVIFAEGDDHPTAAELYQQGLEKYEAGELEAARDLFRRVDTMQLPREERIALYKAMEEIGKLLPTQTPEVTQAAEESAAAMTPAQDAQASPQVVEVEPAVVEVPAAPSLADRLAAADDQAVANPSAAIETYEAIVNDPSADEAFKSVAAARLADARRMSDADRTAAKMMIDAAQKDLEASRFDAAKLKLDAVVTSEVPLGWFERNRISQYLAAIDANAAAQAALAAQAAADARAAAESSVEAADAAATEPAVEVAQTPAPASQPLAVEEETPDQPVVAQAQPQADQAPQPADDIFERTKLLYAQQAFAEGQQAQTAGQLALAVESFERAVKLDPANKEYAAALASVKARRSQELAPATVLDQERSLRTLRADAARAEYQQAMDQARAQAAADSFPAAIESANQAKNVLDRDSQLFSSEEYNQLRAAAVALGGDILDQQRAYDDQRRQATAREHQAQSEDAARDAAKAREKQVTDLLIRARDLQKDMKYDEALQNLNQALWLDPNNIAAQMLKDMCEDAQVLTESRQHHRSKNLYRARTGSNNLEATIPYTELVRYPTDWPELTEIRLSNLDDSGGDSEANHQVQRKIDESVPIDFTASPLGSVIDYLRNTTGVNFFVNWPALEQAGVEPESPISLRLNNVPVEQALRLVLQQVGSEFDPIDYSIIEGVVTISTQRDLQRTTEIRTYDIRDQLVQVPNFDEAPSFSLSDALSNTRSGGGGGGGGSRGGLFGDDSDEEEEEDTPTREEVIELITTLIQDSIGNPQDWAAYGGDVSSIREHRGQLIIKTTPQNHRDIAKLLRDLREERAIQINVESRFLLVENHFLEDIGVDFDFRVTDVGGGFGPIGISQDSVSFTDVDGITNALTPDVVVPTPGIGTGGVAPPITPGVGFPATGRGLDLSVSYLDDFEANLLVKATQTSQRGMSLTAPRLTFFNGQRAYVLVARQVSFISDLEPVPDSGGFDITISYVNTGVVLDVEGTVSADRRYVTMTLRPSLGNLQEPIETIPIGGGTIFDDNGNPIADLDGAFIQTPELEITEVRATVSVPDKGTLLLGGQRLVSEAEIEAGVPVLSKLPILNRLFTNSSQIKDEKTLLILVKPTIILQGEEEERLYPGITADPINYNRNR